MPCELTSSDRRTPSTVGSGHLFEKILPVLVLCAAFAFSAMLLSFVREPVFYNGDGGMKLLMTQQFAKRILTSELRLPAEEWVAQLWARGYYPLEPPFVFDIAHRHVIGQPVTFPAVSAPFYALFGYHGLYVLPVASLVLLLTGMHVTARRLGLSGPAIAIVHAGVGTSYVMLYSAMLSEHVPATMLAWLGIAPILESFSRRVSRRRLRVAGLLLGASGWIRPECLALAAIVIVVWMPMARRRGAVREWAVFSGVTIAVIAGFFTLNVQMFGHPLGTHALHVLGRPISAADHLRAAVHILWFFVTGLARLAPVVLLALFFVVRMRFDVGSQGRASFYFLVTGSVLFLVVASYMVPSEGGLQWGPRYVAPIVPVLSFAVGIGWQHATRQGHRAERILTSACAVALAGYGAWMNGWFGAQNLRNNYAEKILPTIQRVARSGIDQIVVTDQYTAQEMAALMQDRRFYLVPTDDDQPRRLARLAEGLLAAGRQQFLVIVSVDEYTQDLSPPMISNQLRSCWTRRHLGTSFSGYVVYEFRHC